MTWSEKEANVDGDHQDLGGLSLAKHDVTDNEPWPYEKAKLRPAQHVGLGHECVTVLMVLP